MMSILKNPDFRLLDTGLLTAAQNMALDEVLLQETGAGRSRPAFRFLRFDPPAVLVGRHQDVLQEVRLDFCSDHHIDVNRRLTGGGAIYFQKSALGWELFGPLGVWPFTGSFEEMLDRICRTAALALRRFGLDAQFRPRNDLEVEGRKIGGTGGAFTSQGCMFQGTLLIRNEIELFLKSLRVPVEKLKKREIESLKQRVCFLEDLVQPTPDLDAVKETLVQTFEQELDLRISPGNLTPEESRAWAAQTPCFASADWISSRRPKPVDALHLRAFHQTPAGTMRVHLWVHSRTRRIRQTLITGDFFSRPARFVLDLEAALKGIKADRESLSKAIESFFQTQDGEFLFIDPQEVIQAVTTTAGLLDLIKLGFDVEEANNIFLVNMDAAQLTSGRAGWLLLPYCSKDLDCDFRQVPDCGRCGGCDFDRMYHFGERLPSDVFSIQSFEHLMSVLESIKAGGEDDGRFFLGSCCEAFFAKHQREMTDLGLKGVLVNVDSTTCYDLGKGMDAYAGRFDNQTELNCDLIEKVADLSGNSHDGS